MEIMLTDRDELLSIIRACLNHEISFRVSNMFHDSNNTYTYYLTINGQISARLLSNILMGE